jgi:hypothetical protein
MRITQRIVMLSERWLILSRESKHPYFERVSSLR